MHQSNAQQTQQDNRDPEGKYQVATRLENGPLRPRPAKPFGEGPSEHTGASPITAPFGMIVNPRYGHVTGDNPADRDMSLFIFDPATTASDRFKLSGANNPAHTPSPVSAVEREFILELDGDDIGDAAVYSVGGDRYEVTRGEEAIAHFTYLGDPGDDAALEEAAYDAMPAHQ